MERVTGTLDQLLTDLAEATGADCVLTGEISDDDPGVVRVRRMWLDGSWTTETRYELAGTPCEAVFECRVQVVPVGVAETYPQDRMLADLSMQAYFGVPLTDEQNVVQGILVTLFRKPLAAPDRTSRVSERLLGIAERIGFELERLRFEERLAASERRYRSLVEHSSDGILVHRDFTWLYANQAAAELFGYSSPAELMASGTVFELLPEHERMRMGRLLEAYRAGADVPREHDVEALHSSGQELALHVSISEVDWDGEPAHQLVLNDVTARREEEARQQQARRLESIGKLTGGIAHDFNNLLAIILGNLELLEDAIAVPEDRRLLTDAMFAAEQGADLTRRLLSFARRQALQPRQVHVATLLEGVRGLLRRTLAAEITLAMEDRSDAWIRVDPTQLQAALLNLAINARDAMDGPGELGIRAWCVAAGEGPPDTADAGLGWVCLEITDTGAGMPPAVLERAFEPFFTTRSDVQGSGLGLSMVHGFVRQSSGHIEIKSAVGQGTRVRIFLPRDEGPADGGERAAGDGDGQAAATSRQRVLLVEDEPAVRKVAVEMLRSLGLEVVAASDGPGARDWLRQERFDLLLTDVVLPGGFRGTQIAAFARQQDPQLAILFMTGYADVDTFEQFEGLKDIPVMQKPFRRVDLQRHVMACLQARRA